MLTRAELRVPKYCHHKPTDQAYIFINGKRFYLGKYGSEDSHKKFDQILSEWIAQGRQLAETPDRPLGSSTQKTVAEIAAAYWSHAQGYYRKPDGRQTSEIWSIKQMLKVVKRLYGKLPAEEFSPLKLKAVQEHMIRAGMARSTINHHVTRVKGMFRWAVENELITGGPYHSIIAVRGLKRGRSEAKETEPVRPVPDAHIAAVVATLSPSLAKIRQIYAAADASENNKQPGHAPISSQKFVLDSLAAKLPNESAVAAMIELQRLTGMRPGEACIMRTGDITMNDGVWVYRPREHKTEHHGIEKEIAIGPRAQLILRPFLKKNLAVYIFSPAEAERARNQARRAERKTVLTPSARARRRRQRSTGRAGNWYTVASYRRAIERACDQAFPLPADLVVGLEAVKAWRQTATAAVGRRPWLTDMPEDIRKHFNAVAVYRKQFRWHPHQLRHNAATELRRRYGIEAARVILGHRSAAITEVYAEIDKAKALQIMSEVG